MYFSSYSISLTTDSIWTHKRQTVSCKVSVQLSGFVSQTHITKSIFVCRYSVHATLWCFDRADSYKCPCIRHVYIRDVWYDPGVWLWDTAGGLAVSCLSHPPRECQTVYLTRYSLSVFFLSHTHTHTYKKYIHAPRTHNIQSLACTHVYMCTQKASVETPEDSRKWHNTQTHATLAHTQSQWV